MIGYFVILAVLNYSICYQCNVYECSHDVKLQVDQCVFPHVDNSTKNTFFDIDVKSCSSGKFCPALVDPAKNTTCKDRVTLPRTLLDGQSCKLNTDCASNLCNSNKCDGLAESAPCENHNQCKVGYFCGKNNETAIAKNCLKQKVMGEKCSSEYDCLNGFGCFKENCTSYFSLKNGEKGVGDNFILCESGKIMKGTCVTTKLNDASDECKGNQTHCNYNVTGLGDNVVIENTICQCSRAFQDKNFCEMDSNDAKYLKLIADLKSWYTLHNTNFHTVNRHSYHKDLMKNYIYITRYPQFRETENCVMDLEVSELSGGYLKSIFYLLVTILIIWA